MTEQEDFPYECAHCGEAVNEVVKLTEDYHYCQKCYDEAVNSFHPRDCNEC